VSRPPKNFRLSKKEIGERVRALREERGLTQTELGNLLDLRQTNVSAIERGDRGVTIHQAVRIARVLRVSADELLTGNGSAKSSPAKSQDRRFLRRLEQIDKLPKGDKQALLKTIDAFLTKVP
jgi:transcriptional regulator with XRE-family HTH domain